MLIFFLSNIDAQKYLIEILRILPIDLNLDLKKLCLYLVKADNIVEILYTITNQQPITESIQEVSTNFLRPSHRIKP